MKDIVLSGWPDNLRDVPNNIQTVWTFQDEIGVQNGMIYKECNVIILRSMRNKMLEKFHKSHHGIAAAISKTRDVMD